MAWKLVLGPGNPHPRGKGRVGWRIVLLRVTRLQSYGIGCSAEPLTLGGETCMDSNRL